MDFAYLLLKILIVIAVQQATVAYLIYVERKVAAFVQDRVEPNRGRAGQVLAVPVLELDDKVLIRLGREPL